MKRFATPLLVIALGLSLGLAGCSDDGDDDTGTPEVTSEFEGYGNWTQVEYTNASSPFLGPAHMGDNPNYVRAIYSDSPNKTEGVYDVGTIFVKETYTFDAEGNKAYPADMGLLGMIKRDSGFDTDGGDWEYFNISTSDLSTIASGANLGACKSCHTNATDTVGNDHVFAHPYEFMAVNADFDGYDTWDLIGTELGEDAFLGPAHAGNDANAVRKIYKKQLQANPNGWNGYPVGTLFLKTVEDNEGNLMAKTGMAKRGNGFNADNGDWEYFMMDSESGDMMAQGEGSAMCIMCHTSATSANFGMDYVFSHEGDPFNN